YLLCECFLGLYLKVTTFFSLPCFSTLAVTLAPSTNGVPTLTSSPLATRITSSKVTELPSSASSFSTNTLSPSATLYCLPPVLIIAYICTPPKKILRLAELGCFLHKKTSNLKPCGCRCGGLHKYNSYIIQRF